MHQRLKHCYKPARSKDLHIAVVSEVKATSQANALRRLEPYLNDMEKILIKRGRNKAKRRPRVVDATTYGQATGFETIVGWLFLNNPERLAQLFNRLEESEFDLSEPLDK